MRVDSDGDSDVASQTDDSDQTPQKGPLYRCQEAGNIITFNLLEINAKK